MINYKVILDKNGKLIGPSANSQNWLIKIPWK